MSDNEFGTKTEQEIRNEALEEAAQVAYRHAWSRKQTYAFGPELNSMVICNAIRALKEQTND